MTTVHVWPADGMTTPTVSVFVYADGAVDVLADQDPKPDDWQAALSYLRGLGFTGPIGVCGYLGEFDHWSLRLPVAA